MSIQSPTPKKPLEDPELTYWGRRVLQCRLSVGESQGDFAKRLRVTRVCVNMWERGRIKNMSAIYREIILNLYERLRSEGRLVPESAVETYFFNQTQWHQSRTRSQQAYSGQELDSISTGSSS